MIDLASLRINTHQAFNMIMDALISTVENDNDNFDATVMIKLSKKQCRVTISSDICLSNIDTTLFDVQVKDGSSTIIFNAI